MSRKIKNDRKGQASVEYILLLAAIVAISVAFVKSIDEFMGKTSGGMGYVLSKHLSTGVCESSCFFQGFRNN